MYSVVVFGASGFIGKALINELLKRNIEVYAVVRNKNKISEIENPLLKLIVLEIDNYNEIGNYLPRQVDCMFYLSWSGGISNQSFKNIELQLPNLIYFINLCIAIRDKNLTKKLVFISSDRKSKFHKKQYPDIVDCIYGKVKESCENIGKNILFTSNILFNSVVFSNVFGIGDYSLRSTNIILKKLLNNESLDLIDSDTLYDWIYIDDAINGILCVANEGKPYKSYYVGNNKIKTFSYIINTAKQVLNSSSKLYYGKFNEDYYVDYDNLNYKDIYFDTSFDIATNFEDNIRKTAEWIKENKIGE